MNHIRILAGSLAVSAALLVGCMGVSGSSEPVGEVASAYRGTAVNPPWSAIDRIDVRSGPGGNYPVVGWLSEGDTVNITCAAADWYKRDEGGYIHKSSVDVGGQHIPSCS